MLHPSQYRRDPRKRAESVKDLRDRRFTEQERFRAVIRDDSQLIGHIVTNQNTLLLAKLIPSWNMFTQLEYYWNMRRCVGDETMMRKYRAWWDLISELSRCRNATAYAVACLALERLRRKGKTLPDIFSQPFAIDPVRAAKVRELVRTGYEGLTLGS